MNPIIIPMIIAAVLLGAIIIWTRKESEKLNNKK